MLHKYAGDYYGKNIRQSTKKKIKEFYDEYLTSLPELLSQIEKLDKDDKETQRDGSLVKTQRGGSLVKTQRDGSLVINEAA